MLTCEMTHPATCPRAHAPHATLRAPHTELEYMPARTRTRTRVFCSLCVCICVCVCPHSPHCVCIHLLDTLRTTYTRLNSTTFQKRPSGHEVSYDLEHLHGSSPAVLYVCVRSSEIVRGRWAACVCVRVCVCVFAGAHASSGHRAPVAQYAARQEVSALLVCACPCVRVCVCVHNNVP